MNLKLFLMSYEYGSFNSCVSFSNLDFYDLFILFNMVNVKFIGERLTDKSY